MSFIRNWSVRALSRVLILLSLTMGVLVSGAALYSYTLVSGAGEDWRSYREANAPRTRAVGALVDALGYGGMIHQFKNYVLRQDAPRIAKFQQHSGKAIVALERLESLVQDPVDQRAVAQIRGVVGAYVEKLPKAQRLAAEGSTPEQIDGIVKIDDAPALAGLATLTGGATGALQGRAGDLAALRRAMGFGGMIHQFKNYVLRHDAPRIAKVEAAVAAAREAIQGYRAAAPSAIELKALDQIEGVLAQYERGLSKVRALSESGASAREIDKAVKVSDGPALKALATLDRALADGVRSAESNVTATLQSAEHLNLVMTGLIVLLSGAIAMAISFVTSRGVSRPAARLAAEIEKLAAGDLNVDLCDLEGETEMGAIARSAAVFRSSLRDNRKMAEEREAAEAATAEHRRMRDDLQARMRDVVAAALQGDFSRRIDQRYDDPELASFAAEIGRLLESVEIGLAEAGRVVGDLADGDLTGRMTGFESGAFGALQRDVNEAMDRLRCLVQDIQSASATTVRACDAIASDAEQLSARAETQAATLEETSSTMETMSSSIHANAKNAQAAESAAGEAATLASRGGAVVTEAVGAMERIEKSADKISDIISVIESIAFQTNLLALNAAVEAARAGDAGKGFAVVASEVRTLAQRSSEAAKDITSLIQDSTGHVADGARLVRSTGDALQEIDGSVAKVASNIVEISSAGASQAVSVKECASAVQQMDMDTQQNSDLAVRSAENAKALASEAHRLRDLVSFFQLEEKRAAAIAAE